MNRDDCKELYESFKKMSGLDESDHKMIELSERMISSGIELAIATVYSELWLKDWINTTNFRLMVEKRVNGDGYNTLCINNL